MSFNLRCSESMSDFSRIGMIDEDIPNVPDRGRSPLRNFRSQIRAPCALIKDLSNRDKDIAMAFIKALAAQHKKAQRKRRSFERRSTKCCGGSPWYQGSYTTSTPTPEIGSNLELQNLPTSQIVWCPFLTSPVKGSKCSARREGFPSPKCV